MGVIAVPMSDTMSRDELQQERNQPLHLNIILISLDHSYCMVQYLVLITFVVNIISPLVADI